MKKIFGLMIIVSSLFSLSLVSCDDDDDDDKTESISSEESKNVLENEFLLGNQYSKQGCFYDVQSQNATSDTTADFDFAFAYYTVGTMKCRYVIAGATSSQLNAEMKMENVVYKCGKKTIFYELPSNFSVSKFDTLKTVAGLKSVLEKSKKIYNEDNTTDCIYSDQYGWSSGQLFGFQLQSGKYGIIKIEAMPSSYKKGESASCRLNVKWEGED